MEVPIKLLYDETHELGASKLPVYSKVGDACLDLYLHSVKQRDDVLAEKAQKQGVSYESSGLAVLQRVFGSGIAVAIPTGYVGLLFMRSSACNFVDRFTNCVGVIDETYRGEIMAVVDIVGTPSMRLSIISFLETLLEDLEPSGLSLKLRDSLQEIGEGTTEELSRLSFKQGDRFGQLLIIPRPKIELKVVTELPESSRGADSYGSSGR